MSKTPKNRATPRGEPHRVSAHLSYELAVTVQSGARIGNVLFDVLNAVHEGGSIAHAARTLNYSYRYVWGVLKEWETELHDALVVWTQGQPARLTEFGQRLIWAERRARTRVQPHIEALRADLERMLIEASDQDQQVMTVYASHDLALPVLVRHAAQSSSVHLDLRYQSSVDCLRALNAGRCLVAGFHVPALRGAAPVFSAALKPLLRPGMHKLIGCTRRQQGLMLRKEHADRVRSIPDLVKARLQLVNRQVGSGSRLLMDHLIAEHGLDPRSIPGYDTHVEESHVAVAASVASGLADVGLGIKAAAVEFGLHFVPLIEDDYFLVCLKPNLNHPAITRLCQILEAPEWKTQVLKIDGYSPAASAGKVLVMTSALPWWRYRPRAAKATAPQDSTSARLSARVQDEVNN